MDGRTLSEHLKPQLRCHADEIVKRHGLTPALGAILAGDNPASVQYVRNKRRMAADLGFSTELVSMPTAAATTAVTSWTSAPEFRIMRFGPYSAGGFSTISRNA